MEVSWSVSIAIGGIILILLGILFLGAVKIRQAEKTMKDLFEKDMKELKEGYDTED